MKPLTPRQQEVFDLIRSKIDETGMPPTRAEIARELGFRSANAAEEHLKALARKQVIEIVPGASRGIRILVDAANDSADDVGLPLIGRVAAGEPILAQEHVEAHYQVDPAMFRPQADFLLRVHGESMKISASWMAICWRYTKRRMYTTVRLWLPALKTMSP